MTIYQSMASAKPILQKITFREIDNDPKSSLV